MLVCMQRSIRKQRSPVNVILKPPGRVSHKDAARSLKIVISDIWFFSERFVAEDALEELRHGKREVTETCMKVGKEGSQACAG